jgi:hypothetical protein
MSHFAELDEENKVIRVLVGDNNDPAGDEGYSWFVNNLGGRWVQTSYTTRKGKRLDVETWEPTEEEGFRKNFAGSGYTYDEERDAFIPPKQYPSWTLNEEECWWYAPVPYPEDGGLYSWDEVTQSWIEFQ